MSFWPAEPNSLRFDRDLFASVLRETRRGLSASLSGGRNEFYKLCLEDEEALDSLTDVAECIARGLVPPAIRAALALSQLTAILKTNGKVRGIAAGDALRRLVEKTLAKQFSSTFRQEVSPLNFGLADRSGTDGLIHLLRSSAERDPHRTIVSIDGIGAYDHISRSRMFQELWNVPSLRSLIPYARLFLGQESQFVWRDEAGISHMIRQGEGGEQGAALMPALFCLALKPALAEIQAALQPDEQVYAYLDDIYVVTSPARVRAVFDLVSEVLYRVCRIRVNRGKLVAWNASGSSAPADVAELDTPASSGVTAHTVWTSDLPAAQCGVTVLGSPIGSDAFVHAFSERLLDDERAFFNKLAELPCSQHAWLLLSYCGAPRANYRLRTIPPHQCAFYARGHDEAVLQAFSRLLGAEGVIDGSLADWARQMRLPCRFAGLGLRSAVRTSPTAYWASWNDCIGPLSIRFPQFWSYLAV